MKLKHLAVILALAAPAWAQPPIYCEREVIKAMNIIWHESALGTSGREGAFELDHDRDTYEIILEPVTGQIGFQTINTRPGLTFAVFHVHPNMGTGEPSTPTNNFQDNKTGDTGIADLGHFDIYVVSNRGLSVYYWETKRVVWLRHNTEWASAKGCR